MGLDEALNFHHVMTMDICRPFHPNRRFPPPFFCAKSCNHQTQTYRLVNLAERVNICPIIKLALAVYAPHVAVLYRLGGQLGHRAHGVLLALVNGIALRSEIPDDLSSAALLFDVPFGLVLLWEGKGERDLLLMRVMRIVSRSVRGWVGGWIP